LKEGGFISFFTTGEKETRAWLIRNGDSAWVASGAIHSDIQQGFIRAEIISFNDFMECGGENKAKQAGKLKVEQKDYVMQDCDLANFRFNK
jgi:ribosome-binding ATPase